LLTSHNHLHMSAVRSVAPLLGAHYILQDHYFIGAFSFERIVVELVMFSFFVSFGRQERVLLIVRVL
jgi:hypothetical protein